jgi:hypothetical protein
VRTTLADNLTLDPEGRVYVSSFNEPVITIIERDGTTRTITVGQR